MAAPNQGRTITASSQRTANGREDDPNALARKVSEEQAEDKKPVPLEDLIPSGEYVSMGGRMVRILPLTIEKTVRFNEAMDQLGDDYIQACMIVDNPNGTLSMAQFDTSKIPGMEAGIPVLSGADVRMMLRQMTMALVRGVGNSQEEIQETREIGKKKIKAMYELAQVFLNTPADDPNPQRFSMDELHQMLPITAFPHFLCRCLDYNGLDF